MRLQELKIFLEICRLRSIRKAAAHLGLSQPSITKLLQRMEHEVGAHLLQRTPRGVEPTLYGKTLERHAKFAVSEIEHAKQIIRGISSGEVGLLRLGVSTTASHVLLPSVVERVRLAHPGTDIRVTEDTIDALAIGLQAGDFDVVIAPLPRLGMDCDVETSHLLDDELVIIGRAEHPEFANPRPNLATLLAYPWIFIGEDPLKESQLVPLLLRHKLPPPKWTIQTNSIGFLIDFLLRSDCVALQSRRLAEAYSQRGIRTCRIPGTTIYWPIMISFRKKTVMTPLMEKFIAEAVAWGHSGVAPAAVESSAKPLVSTRMRSDPDSGQAASRLASRRSPDAEP